MLEGRNVSSWGPWYCLSTYNETYVTLCGLGIKVVSKQLKRKITTFTPLCQVGQAKVLATLSSTLAAFLHLHVYEFLPLANK